MNQASTLTDFKLNYSVESIATGGDKSTFTQICVIFKCFRSEASLPEEGCLMLDLNLAPAGVMLLERDCFDVVSLCLGGGVMNSGLDSGRK